VTLKDRRVMLHRPVKRLLNFKEHGFPEFENLSLGHLVNIFNEFFLHFDKIHLFRLAKGFEIDLFG